MSPKNIAGNASSWADIGFCLMVRLDWLANYWEHDGIWVYSKTLRLSTVINLPLPTCSTTLIIIPTKNTLPLNFGFYFASCKTNGFISVIIEEIYFGQLDCFITKYSEEPMKSLSSFLPSLIFIKSSSTSLNEKRKELVLEATTVCPSQRTTVSRRLLWEQAAARWLALLL